MKKAIYTDFVEAGELIEQLMEQKEFKKAVTRSNLYKFWSKAVGEKFAQKSRPYGMSANNVMIIACESAAAAQELTLRKVQILDKFAPYLQPLRMTVKDLKFDPRKW